MAWENYGALITALLKRDPEFGSQNFFDKFCDTERAPLRIGLMGSAPHVLPAFDAAIPDLLNLALHDVHDASLKTLALLGQDDEKRHAIEADMAAFFEKLLMMAKRVRCDLHQLKLLEMSSSFGAAVFNSAFEADARDLASCLGLETVLKTVPAGTRPSMSLTQDALSWNNIEHIRLLAQYGVLDTEAFRLASDEDRSLVNPETRQAFAQVGGKLE